MFREYFRYAESRGYIDRSHQKLRISALSEEEEIEAAMARRQFEVPEEAYQVHPSGEFKYISLESDVEVKIGPPPLQARIVDFEQEDTFLPLFALQSKAKAFDDRLMAALERINHLGCGPHPGLFEIVERLRKLLSEGTEARGLLDAATHLRDEPLPKSTKARLYAKKALKPFLENQALSNPVGVYRKDTFLSQVFQHDRLLQTALKADKFSQAQECLQGNQRLTEAYQNYLRVIERITNPFVSPSILGVGDTLAFLPASDSLENRMMKELYGDKLIPEGFEVLETLISRIRAGLLNAKPRATDGWYAHQFFASTALLFAQKSFLEVDENYQEHLDKLFKGAFVLNRETHVKQLEFGAAGGCFSRPMEVKPRLSLEPLPEYYQRIGDAYSYLYQQLAELWPEQILDSEAMEGHDSVGTGLKYMEGLFRGAAAVSMSELGQRVEQTEVTSLSVASFKSWHQTWIADEDLATDLRVAVPIYYDERRRNYRLNCLVGLLDKEVTVSFVEKPQVYCFDGEGQAQPFADVEFYEQRFSSVYPVTIECNVKTIPTREQLREICDEHQEPEAIKKALEALWQSL